MPATLVRHSQGARTMSNDRDTLTAGIGTAKPDN
jgi:hypothetical protein